MKAAVAGPDWPIAPWYFEQLAIVYRKEHMLAEEVRLLERYVAMHALKRERPLPHLTDRLAKVRARQRLPEL